MSIKDASGLPRFTITNTDVFEEPLGSIEELDRYIGMLEFDTEQFLVVVSQTAIDNCNFLQAAGPPPPQQSKGWFRKPAPPRPDFTVEIQFGQAPSRRQYRYNTTDLEEVRRMFHAFIDEVVPVTTGWEDVTHELFGNG